MKTSHIILILILITIQPLRSQVVEITDTLMIGGHRKILDAQGGILSWHKPDTPGAAYDHVMKLASGFIKSGVPVDPATGLKLYYISCCFQGPHMRTQEDFDKGITWEHWPNNPACVFAGLVRSLAAGYRVYSGDAGYLEVIRGMLDYQIENGTTPAGWPWPGVPYASSDPGSPVFEGATRWENDGMRGDGLHGIEPDKVGEMGLGYLQFYEITEEPKYLDAALKCGYSLMRHVRDMNPDSSPFAISFKGSSPWPFRVNARTGNVISEYCSNAIEPVHLLDELIRISDRINLPAEQRDSMKMAREIAWTWLYSKDGPMKTYIWNGYFEDVPNDPERLNRTQITPMETARYLLYNPSFDPDMDHTVPALLYWVKSAFATEGMDAIKEQTWCYEPMGSHTARYASICALWYERTGDPAFREEAFRHFNLATYMTDENGVVRVGPTWPGSWFSDGYGDYIRHFYEGMAAIPEWSPAGENHLLRSTSVVQSISYQPGKISYRTYDARSVETLSLAKKPRQVNQGGKTLKPVVDRKSEGWIAKPLSNGNFRITVIHSESRDIEIIF